jgi:predicted PurR-regulated permease PerM
MNNKEQASSPRWGAMTKLVVTLVAVFILGALLVRFKFVVAPVVMAFILTYLLFPLALLIIKKTPLSWKVAINIIYLMIVLILLALLAWGGVGLFSQVQNVINTVQDYIKQLPTIIDSLSHKVLTLGSFRLDLSTIDWQKIGTQVLSTVEPAIGKLGSLVGTLASSAVSTLGWTAFVIILSYFFLLESGGFRNRILNFDLPGYKGDLGQLGFRLGRIWNAFLRGQIIIFISKVITYSIILSILGVHYAIGLALIAGFAGFLPYIGPAINWIVLVLVTYFQGVNPFGISPLAYTIIVFVVALVIDQVFDNLVFPRIMANTLKVHPAFVLIAAIIAANLFGILGILLAAPLLATLQLVGRYTMRKMLEKDPWENMDEVVPSRTTWKWLRKLRRWWQDQKTRRKNSTEMAVKK